MAVGPTARYRLLELAAGRPEIGDSGNEVRGRAVRRAARANCRAQRCVALRKKMALSKQIMGERGLCRRIELGGPSGRVPLVPACC